MKAYVAAVLLVLMAGAALAHISAEGIEEAEALIKAKTSCSSLTQEQLELLGEYYMEQMHPGTAHELMHQMMGLEEGTDTEEQFHINMAERIYCGKYAGMMGYGYGTPMMGASMMGSSWPTDGDMRGYGGYGMLNGVGANFYWGLHSILLLLLLAGLVLLVYLWIWKLWKSSKIARK
jgi:hypothetical protein